jgi:type I restriction enzyme S subunit
LGGGEVQTGPFGSQLHASDYLPDGVPSIMPQNIGDNRVVQDGIARVAIEDAERLARYLVRPGDIVYSRRGDVERRALIRTQEDGWLCGTGCLRVRLGEGPVDPIYAAYYLGDPRVREWVVRHAHGATMPNLNTGILSALPLAVPPRRDQHAIAHILGTLDDKIELNRRMNETLEAIARALFKSWFVDFDPVRAKSEGRDPGLPPHLADLFPDSFEETELGEIPKGWRVSGLDETATYLNGLALQKYPPDDSGSLPVIKIAQLRAGHTDGADRASADIPPAYVVEDGDVLFSWSGSLEVEIWCGGCGALNQHLFKVTSGRFPKWFYFLWTRHHLPGFRGIAAGKATTMGHIQRGHLSAARALVPPPRLVEAMSAHFEPLLEDLIAGRLQSRALAALRDALLPKLIAGELRVSDVERSMGSMQ